MQLDTWAAAELADAFVRCTSIDAAERRATVFRNLASLHPEGTTWRERYERVAHLLDNAVADARRAAQLPRAS